MFRSPADLATLKWGYKKSRELARRLGVHRGEFTPGNPKFKENSPALCKATDGPIGVDASDIAYDADDDKVIEQYNRNFVQTAWHSVSRTEINLCDKF